MSMGASLNYSEIISEKYGMPINFPLDQNIHRFGKKKEIWCVGKEWVYKDKKYFCVNYGNFKHSDGTHQIKSWDDDKLTVNEKRSVNSHQDQLKIQAQKEKDRAHKECSDAYKKVFSEMEKPRELHPYLVSKGLAHSHGAFVVGKEDRELHLYPGTFLVPVYNDSKEIAGAQRIYQKDGKFEKRYSSGVKLIGSYFPFGDWENSDVIYLAEGFATAATIYEITNTSAICCFQASNLPETLLTIRHYNPTCKVVICADKDEDKKGEIYAKKAHRKFNNTVVRLVEFPDGSPDCWSDFNDLASYVSRQQVADQLKINVKEFDIEQYKKDIKNGFTLKDEESGRITYDYDRLLEFFYSRTKYFHIGDTGQIYTYQENHYRPINDARIQAFAEKYFFPKPKNTQRQEFLRKVKANNLEEIDVLKIKEEPLINFKNCVLNYETKEVFDCSPDFKFTYCIPHNYDPSANCPTWDLLLENLLEDKSLIDQLHEFIGFTISGMSYDKHQKLAIFYGEGENGKTTLLDIIGKLVGKNNYSSVEMATINQRFSMAPLEFSLLNKCEEEPKTSFRKSGPVKRLTGNSSMVMEHKGKPPYNFINRSKIVCTFNELPEFLDSSHGMYRRFLLIPFLVNLKNNPEKKIPNIHQVIQHEYPGIINRALEGLYRLIDNDGFTETDSHNKLLEEIRRDSDPIHDYICDRIIVTGNEMDFVPYNRIFNTFKDFYGESKLGYSERYFHKKFWREVEKSGVTRGQKWINGANVRSYAGIKLIELH